MGNLLKGRVAVVTGAGRGIGRAEALALAAQGALAVVNNRLGTATDGSGTLQSPAEEVVAEIRNLGGQAVANTDSVATMEGAERIIRTALDNFGRIDILVNNAGILRNRAIFHMRAEEWDEVMKVNLYGHFYCTKFACMAMRQQRYGRIINTSSLAGLGNMSQANYSASKEGIVGFTRTVARDMGRYGVTCNAIRPRAATRMTMNPEVEAAWKWAQARGLPTLGDYDVLKTFLPEHVAPLVVYLASEAAGRINGQVFLVAGSMIALYPEPTPVRYAFNEKGAWSPEELVYAIPRTLAKDLVNPAPPEAPR